jgi:hypothetical protein
MYRLRPKAFGRLNCLAVLLLSTIASAEPVAPLTWPQETPPLFRMEQIADGSNTCSDDFYFAPTNVPNQLPHGVPDRLASSQSSSYVPLSGQQKFALFLRRSYAPSIFTSAAFDATYSHVIHDWPGYGQGADGFGKRYGATLANAEAGSFFQGFLMPYLLHQDPRYLPSKDASRFSRAMFATSRVLITRSDSGRDTFNSSLLAGTVLSRMLTNAYYPTQQRGLEPMFGGVGGSLLSDVQTNLLREFGPDIQRFIRKHQPGELRRLKDRLFP